MNREIYLSAEGTPGESPPFGKKGRVTVVLFDESGHLVPEALAALHDGTLNEGERLAVSEHLCDCDECLQRYTDTLCGETLMEPPWPVAPGVEAELERRGRLAKGLGAKGFAVAVCFTAGIWLLAMLAAPARREPMQIESMQPDRVLLVENTKGCAAADRNE